MEASSKILAVLCMVFTGCAALEPLILDAIDNNPGIMITEEQAEEEPSLEPEVEEVREVEEVAEEASEPEEKEEAFETKEFFNVGEETECFLTPNPVDCCDAKFGDGRGGLLYTLGEHSKQPVLVTPSRCGRVETVELCGPKGCKKARNTGLTNPDYTVDGRICRDHHRWDVSARQLAKELGTDKPQVKLYGRCAITRLRKGLSNRHD